MTSSNLDKLTSILIDGKNYNIWARQASFGLIGREKLEYVNGEIIVPVPRINGAPIDEEKKTIREWRKNDNRVAG
jgi:gag-polypeptide of LTR copia-type